MNTVKPAVLLLTALVAGSALSACKQQAEDKLPEGLPRETLPQTVPTMPPEREPLNTPGTATLPPAPVDPVDPAPANPEPMNPQPGGTLSPPSEDNPPPISRRDGAVRRLGPAQAGGHLVAAPTDPLQAILA